MALRQFQIGILAVALILVGCSSHPSQLALLKQEISAAKRAALDCHIDTSFAPVEHSENCLITVRILMNGTYLKVCPKDDGLHCRQIGQEVSEINGIYSHAVALSLWSFGKPKEFDRTPSGISGLGQFFDPQQMERAFKNCLAEEAEFKKGVSFNDAIERDGGVWPATIVMNPLKPGQKCIRAGSAVVATQRQI